MEQNQYLMKLKSEVKEKRLYSFDVETIGKNNKFYLGGIYDEKDGYRKFYSKQEYAEELFFNKKYRENCNIVATNLEFDFMSAFQKTKMLNEFKLIISGSRLICASHSEHFENSHKTNKINFIDSLNFGMASVEKLGKLINLPKLPHPKAFMRKAETEEETKELEEYNKRDCEITYKYMQQQQKFFNNIGCNMKITIASTSMDLFKRKYLTHSLKRVGVENYDELFKGYYGGRTEIFKRGRIKNVNYYDLNSLYPSVMVNEYPYPASFKIINNPTNEILDEEGVSLCEVVAPDNNIMFLPVRTDKLIFPKGKFTGWYSHLELRKAIELGYKIEIIKSFYYVKTFHPFKEYVLDLYKSRVNEKDEFRKTQYKLLMNSLYGKFAQRENTDIEILDMENQDNIKNNIKDDVYINDYGEGYALHKKECESSFVIPILSIYTTAYARLKLFDYLNKYNPYYCDTDSIITKKELPTSNKLGDMKLERFIKDGVLIKPKLYMLDNEIFKIKGAKINNITDFNELIKNKTTHRTKLIKIRESIRQNKEVLSQQDILKNINLEDNKRVWFTPFNAEILDENSEAITL